MAREDPQLKLRLTEEMKAKVTEAAKSNNRSVNAEIVARLEESFAATSSKSTTELLEVVKSALDQMHQEIVNERKWTWGMIENFATGNASEMDVKLLEPLFPKRQKKIQDLYDQYRRAVEEGDDVTAGERRRDLEAITPKFFKNSDSIE